MIEKDIIEEAVQKFLEGPDLEVHKGWKHDLVALEAICMRMNYLKHAYFRVKKYSKEASDIFDRMCRIIPGFMLMEE